MLSSEKVVIARPLNDAPREVRIIPALYSQECLEHPAKPLDPHPIAASPDLPPAYQNTGVQTLPPANGSVFKQIHGREPSQIDYVRSMGSAGIGRFADDPRLNHYDLMYGATYSAPTTVKRKKFADSGFQTASHGTSRKALAKAKVKASMTATRYRDAASRAGYVICAESRDELIIHSEQFSKVVQLDADGNLLEGTVESRGLPNIFGAPVLPTTSALEGTAQHTQHGVMAGQAPYLPTAKSLKLRPQAVSEKPRNLVADVSALTPSPTGQACDGDSVLHREYGSAEPEMNRVVVYDLGIDSSGSTQSSGDSVSSLRKRKSKGDLPPVSPPRGLKAITPALPRSHPTSVAAPVATPLSQPDYGRDTLLRTSKSDLKVSLGSPQLDLPDPCDVHKQRVLTAVQSGTQSKVVPRSIASSATNIPGTQEQISGHKSSDAPSIGNMKIAAQMEEGSLLRAEGNISHRQCLKEPKPSQPTQNSPNSSAPSVLSETRDVQLHPNQKGLKARDAERSSLRPKRSFNQTGFEPTDYKPGTKRLRIYPETDQQNNDSYQQKLGPRKIRDSSLGRSQATNTHLEKPEMSSSAHIEKKPVSRASRTPRQPITPYVPPAMRARGQKDSKAEKSRPR